MTEKTQSQQEITTQLADLTETMQRENIKFSPEMQKYFDETLAELTDKMAKGKMPLKKELDEFIKTIKTFIENEIFKIKLKSRFEENKYLHEGVDWEKVIATLIANPIALKSINEMEKAGHEPNVYNADDDGFDIGTCSKETPIKSRKVNFKNAKELANVRGFDLMTPDQYKEKLQKKLPREERFDAHSACWLETSDEEYYNTNEFAYVGNCRDGLPYITKQDGKRTNPNLGWRGSLRVPWKK